MSNNGCAHTHTSNSEEDGWLITTCDNCGAVTARTKLSD
jgi:hypothetical protein